MGRPSIDELVEIRGSNAASDHGKQAAVADTTGRKNSRLFYVKPYPQTRSYYHVLKASGMGPVQVSSAATPAAMFHF